MLKEKIIALAAKRYKEAAAIFWGGSLACGTGTSTSDIDLVVVYEELPNAYREAFIHECMPYDVFVHDINTLRYFFKEIEVQSGIPALIKMILNGQEITPPTEFSSEVKKLASEYFALGSPKWNEKDIDKERFFITDSLDDIIESKSMHEQIASACWLYEALGQFYLRSNQKWVGSGKALARRMAEEDPHLAEEFEQAFNAVFQKSDTKLLLKLAEKVLKPFGGMLRDGFRQDASKEWTSKEIMLKPDIILTEPITKEVHDKILSGIRAFNKSKVGEYTRKEFNIYMKSPEGNIISGIEGDYYSDGLLRIFMLWVNENYRMQGVGRKLMNALEQYALARGCKTIQLETMAFQARGFYEKLGFEVAANVEKGLLGHDLYIMRKNLKS